MAQILLRRDTAANWQSANPVLGQGELGVETDTGKAKLGDGSTAWNDLAYFKDVTFTSTHESDIETVLNEAHTHVNKALLDVLTNSGDGTKFLSDDGTYKVINNGTATDFVSLTDTPSSYSGAAGKAVAVKSTEDGVEFVDFPSGSGAATFDDLADTPDTKVAGKYVRVSDDGTSLIYADSTGTTTIEGAVVIDSVLDLINYSDGVQDGTAVFVKSFWPGYTIGGGWFVWDSNADMNKFDGGCYLKSKTLGDGLWVRIKSFATGFNPAHYGTVGGAASGSALTTPLSKFFTSLSDAQWFYPFVDDLATWSADEAGFTQSVMTIQRNGTIYNQYAPYWSRPVGKMYLREFSGTIETYHGLYLYSCNIRIENDITVYYKGAKHGTLERPQYVLKVEGMPAAKNRAGVHSTPTWQNHKAWWDEDYPVWQPGTAYSVGDRVYPTGASYYLYECVVAGTSGDTEPTWDETDDGTDAGKGTTTDGTVTWKTVRAFYGNQYNAMNLSFLTNVAVDCYTSVAYTEKEYPRVNGVGIGSAASNCRFANLNISADWDGIVFYGLGMLSPVENIRINDCGRDGIVWTQYYGDFTTCVWAKKLEIANYGRYGICAYNGGVWTDFVFEDIDVEAWVSTRCDGLFSDDYSWYWQGVPASIFIRGGSDTVIRGVRTEAIGADHVEFHFFDGVPWVETIHEMKYFISRSVDSKGGTTQAYKDFLEANYRNEITPDLNAYVATADTDTYTSVASDTIYKFKAGATVFLTKNSGVPFSFHAEKLNTITVKECNSYPSSETMIVTPVDDTNYALVLYPSDAGEPNRTNCAIPIGAKIQTSFDTPTVLDGVVSNVGLHRFRDYTNHLTYVFNPATNHWCFVDRFNLNKPIANFKGIVTPWSYNPWWVRNNFYPSTGYVEMDSDQNVTVYAEQQPFTVYLHRTTPYATPDRFKTEAPTFDARKWQDYEYRYGDTFHTSNYSFTGTYGDGRFTHLVVTAPGWFGKDWPAETTVSTGTYVAANKLVWTPSESGKTCGVMPQFTSTIGDTVTEQPDYTTWAASTDYTTGSYVMPSTANGFFYEATTGGTSGSTEPTWPTTNGATVTDGSVTWTARKIVTWVAKKTEAKMEWTHRVYETNKISGTTADRPSVTEIGFQYFDTDLGKPIYWNGSGWVDATGTAV